jgi:hypothetical protein
VRTVTLSRLLAPFDCIDLIDLDVQGAELEVLAEAAPSLAQVGRLHVETHSGRIEGELPAVFPRRAEGRRRHPAVAKRRPTRE